MRRLGVSAILVLLTLMACTRQEDEAGANVFKDQAQAMEKAKQTEAVIEQHAEDLQDQVEAHTGKD